MSGAPYRVLWQYRVRPDAVDRFLAHYGPGGDWVRLFRRAKGYRGTTLLRDATDDRVFVTMDVWTSEADRSAFLDEFAAEYRALDQACEDLTEWERPIGG
jgi:heme-degrading monooxygenase HmoA